MKVLIAGASGIIGNCLVNLLLDKDHEIFITTRKESRVKNDWKDMVTIHEVDVGGPQVDLSSIVSGMDAIVNLIGENIFSRRWTKKRKNKIRDSRIISNQNLMNGIKKSSEPPNIWVSPSGIDYYPYNQDGQLNFSETDETNDSFLGQLCLDWETPIQDLADLPIRTVIIRFAPAFSRSGKLTERMFIPHKLFFGGWIGSGKQWLTWIHEDDFAGIFVWAIENDVRGIFNGVAPDPKTMKEIAKVGGKILGRWTWTWVPGFMLKVILGERADLLLKGRKVSAEKIIDEGYKFKFPKIQSALEDILLKP